MHKSFARLLFALCVLAALPLALSACSAESDTDESNAPVITDAAPPSAPLVDEQIPVIADPQNEIWRSGYWALSGPNFAWVPGKVIPRPSPTAVWVAARWERHNYGWSFTQGHWQ